MTDRPPPPPVPPHGAPPPGGRPPHGAPPPGGHPPPPPVGVRHVPPPTGAPTPWPQSPPAHGFVPPPVVPPSGDPPRQRRPVRLNRVRSPYAVWVALLSVAIFCAPNLLTLVVDTDAVATQTTDLSEAELIIGLIFTIVLQLVVFVLALLPLLAAGRPYSRLFGPAKGTPAMFAIGLGVGVAVVVITYTVNAVAVLVFGDGTPVEQDLVDYALSGGAVTFLAVLIAVVVAPVVEEVIFRGVLFRALSARMGLIVATVLSSAIFAVIHFEVLFSQPLALVGLFTVGALLAVAYHLTGSLIVPIVGHAVFNATSLGLVRLFEQLDPLPVEAMIRGVGT